MAAKVLRENLCLAWSGDFESLKLFLKEDLKFNGTWMQPGGDKKLFSSENLTISWRRDKSILSFEGEKVDGLKKDLCDMLLERGEYNNNSDINSNHNYSGKDFDIYNEISLKTDQSINREMVQSLSNSISHFAEVISNLQEFQDSVYKKSKDFVDISNSPKGKVAEYQVNNLNDLHMNTPLESLGSTIEDNHDSITANLGQAFLSRVPHLIANFLITFAILKKLLANFLRNIAIFHSRSKVPHFLSSLPVIPRVLTSGVKVLTYIGLTNSYFFYYNSQRQMNEFCCSGWILLLIYKEYLSPHFVAKFICLADRDGQSNRFILKM